MSKGNAFWNWIRDDLFVAATGIAAFVHSTWTLATVFTGEIPAVQGLADLPAWLYSIIPAALIALAVDVGQISTSKDIRNGERTRAKFITFAVLAGATYYLQWFFLAHHTPSMALGAGVRSEWAAFATAFRDLSLWIIPALLPLATMLYTSSHAKRERARPQQSMQAPSVATERKQPARNNGALTGELSDAVRVQADGSAYAECPHCDWRKRYKSAKSARMAVTAHLRLHAESDAKVHANGHAKALAREGE
jgi:hypothetical protein